MASSLWTISFGKYKGKDIEDVPNSYLEWLVEQDWFLNKFANKVIIVEKELAYRSRFDIVVEDET